MAKRKRKKRDLSTILMTALMIAGWYVMMFPKSADLLNRIYNQNTIISYNSTMASYSDEEIEGMLENCKKYNNAIYEEQQTTQFRYRGPTATDSVYKSLPTKSSEIGTLRIPSIDVNVGIVHGTTDNELQSEAGHLYGTSLPVEGENVHAVIAAHSALSTAKLFTDLGKVKKDEKFYITVLNQEYEYKVVDINVVLPTEEAPYEQIEEGKNYVTLYTCTPYGVNTHRLLVKGELAGSTKVEGEDGGFSLREYADIIKNSSIFALIILAPFILMLVYSIKMKHEKESRKKQISKQTDKRKERGSI